MSFQNTMMERQQKIKALREKLPAHYQKYIRKDLENRGLERKRSQIQNFMNGLSWDEEIYISLQNVAELMEKNKALGIK
ncbi:MAG: hypothetical protein H7Y04_15980 [Verrucomicrobia bacterium]|nr:hypothetical protein [Cytophagales bacterium]